MEKPPNNDAQESLKNELSPELQEQLEQFGQEIEAAIEMLTPDALAELQEMGMETNDIQMVFEDFESWENVYNSDEQPDAWKEEIKNHIGENPKQIDQYKIQGAEDVGEIEVTIYKTDIEGVNFTKFKYENGDKVFALRPQGFEEEKI